MRAHADDLRAEVEQDAAAAVDSEAIAARGSDGTDDPRLAALLRYAEKLARTPEAMDAGDLAPLRERGLDDRAIHDLAQAVAYFSYINRIADGLGVDLEPEMEPPDP